jgi:hypothetical protein
MLLSPSPFDSSLIALWNLMMELRKNVKLSSVSETKEVFANFNAKEHKGMTPLLLALMSSHHHDR